MRSIFQRISMYLHPKMIGMCCLGFSSGLPRALPASTLLAWLATLQVDIKTIGLFALVSAPYSLKFLWSPIIDGWKLPWLGNLLGRRVSWAIFTQVAVIGAIIAMAFTNPLEHLALLALLSLCLSFASASQDVVLDAYRIEILDDKQAGAGIAMMVFGYRFALQLIAGAAAFFIASYFGWVTAYLIMALCMSVGVVTILLMGEPTYLNPSEDPKQATVLKQTIAAFQRHVIAPFAEFMSRPSWIVVLLFIIFFKFSDAFAGFMTNPFLVDMGFSLKEIATVVKGVGLIATLSGLFIGGICVARFELLPLLWFSGLIQMVTNGLFAMQAHLGHDIYFLSFTILAENLSGGIGTAVFVSYLSKLCNISYTATQYALLSSLATIGQLTLQSSSGIVVEMLGWSQFFIFTMFLAIPGFIFLYIVHGVERKLSQPAVGHP